MPLVAEREGARTLHPRTASAETDGRGSTPHGPRREPDGAGTGPGRGQDKTGMKKRIMTQERRPS